MRELALHVLDLVENSIAASAGLVEVRVVEDEAENVMRIEIADDGNGLAAPALAQFVSPFYTTKPGKRTGLGVPMLAQAARDASGEFRAEPRAGGGTRLAATFVLNHLDRMPLGDLRGTMAVLACSHPAVHFVCEHVSNGSTVFRLDTREAHEAGEAAEQDR